MSPFFWGFSLLIGGIALAIFVLGVPLVIRAPKNKPTIIWIAGLCFSFATLCLAIYFVAEGSYLQDHPPFFKYHGLLVGPLFYTSQYLQPLFLRTTRQKISSRQLFLLLTPLTLQFGMAIDFVVNPNKFLDYSSIYSGALFSLHLSIGFFIVIAWILYETTKILKEGNNFLIRIVQLFAAFLVVHTLVCILLLLIDFQGNQFLSNYIGGLSRFEFVNRVLRMSTFCIFEVILSIYWFQTYSLKAIEERVQRKKIIALAKEKDILMNNLANANALVETGALSAGLAHEINQFLGRIELNGDKALDLINRSSSQPSVIEPAIQNMLNANRSAAKVIKSLQVLFKGSHRPLALCNLDELFLDVVSIYHDRLQKSKINIEVELQAKEPWLVWDGLMSQVFSNLLSNSIDALDALTKVDKTIWVVSQIDQHGSYQLMLTDNGLGVDPQYKDKLFHLFQSSKSTGLGIGLWLSNYIVERHEGTLTFENLPHCSGVRFVLTLPRGKLNTQTSLPPDDLIKRNEA